MTSRTAPGALNRAGRGQALRDATIAPIDVLVVGAGATGTGTALDAAARGMTVLLVDKGDIASGTSSKSSQLVHGGLRYLQRGDVTLVREALHERELLLTTLAPSLVRPMPFILPLRHRFWERAYVGAGLAAYDVLARSATLPRHRHLSRTGALERFPDLRADRVVGGLQYYDAKMDDARLALAIARTAAQHGAKVAPHVAFLSSEEQDDAGRRRVHLRDELTGGTFTITTRSIALCTGVWTPQVAAHLAGKPSTVAVTRSKGVHLRLPRDAINGTTALIVPTGQSVLFVIPESDHWLVGTTDTPWTQDPDEVRADEDDVDYLLGLLRGVLARPIDRGDVTYVFAGLRPLVRDESVVGDTTKLSREHRVVRIEPNVLAIIGGKWTTYRIMARDLVDAIGHESGWSRVPSTTERIPLVADRNAEVEYLIAQDASLGQTIVGAPGYRRADVAHAVLFEGAATAADVIERRLRLPLHLDQVTDETLRDIDAVSGELAL